MRGRTPIPSGGFSVHDVFTPTMPARVNFVHRRAVNDQLVDALRTPGKQLIVFGESGSGKTSLLLKKLDETYPGHVTTRCHTSLTFDQLLLSAFDQLDPYYVEGRQTTSGRSLTSSLSSDFVRIRASVDYARDHAMSVNHGRLLPPQLTVQRLGEFLGAGELCWLIEDFHKMPTPEKAQLSQSLKVFSDLSSEFGSVKIVAIGATETARQVVEYDPEMRNRVSELLVPLMDDDEISEIVAAGSRLLNVDMGGISQAIVQYAVGVPSVCHQLALNACLEKRVEATEISRVPFYSNDLTPAAERYVRESHDTLKATFDHALRRGRVRKYDNTRMIISALAAGPLAGMMHSEILSDIRNEHPEYPPSNLTTYLRKLQSDDHGPLIRRRSDGRYRFVDPASHTFAQVVLGVKPVVRDHSAWRSRDFERLVRSAMDTAIKQEQLPFYTADRYTVVVEQSDVRVIRGPVEE